MSTDTHTRPARICQGCHLPIVRNQDGGWMIDNHQAGDYAATCHGALLHNPAPSTTRRRVVRAHLYGPAPAGGYIATSEPAMITRLARHRWTIRRLEFLPADPERIQALVAARRAGLFPRDATTHNPRPGSVHDQHGAPCPRATRASYPLTADCTCGAGRLVCADGTADWHHPRAAR